MTLQAAIQQRILDLCQERSITIPRLCSMSGVPTDTIQKLFQDRHHDIRVSTITRLCEGLGISLADFFCCDTFRNIEK